jgi:hypothetical protein
MWNWLFGLAGGVACEESPYVKENNEHALDFICLAFFGGAP